MKKTLRKTFICFLCFCTLCCGCTLPRGSIDYSSGNSWYIYDELPEDNSIFATMDMVSLIDYTTYHYDKAGNLEETDSYGPRDTDDGTWGWHERKNYTYDNENRLILEQRFLPYVNNFTSWQDTSYTYFEEGYSTTCTYRDTGDITSYYDTNGNLLLKQDDVHHSNSYVWSYEYDTETGSVEEYLKTGKYAAYLNWSSSTVGENTKMEILHHNWGPPNIVWLSTYNDNGERISGDWCKADDLPDDATEETYADYCLPGYRTHYENGYLIETTRQEWDRNVDTECATYTLYDYDVIKKLALKITYDRVYRERLTLERYEYDDLYRLARQYEYEIDLEKYKDWSLPLSDGGAFLYSSSDGTTVFKKLYATREVQSMLYASNGRFQVQYIGSEKIIWRP